MTAVPPVQQAMNVNPYLTTSARVCGALAILASAAAAQGPGVPEREADGLAGMRGLLFTDTD